MIKRYRKKSTIIEAVQWTGDNYDEIQDFVDGECCLAIGSFLYVETLDGFEEVRKGDYIIKDIENEFYLCKEGIFNRTYEEV